MGSFLGGMFPVGSSPAGGTATGGGFMGALGELFKNKLFLQYLSGVGADLLGNTPGKNINAITQQNIASQNYMKMLQQMLGGNVPEGGKITYDDTGMKIQVPRTKESGFNIPEGGSSAGSNALQSNAAISQMSSQMLGLTNPFGSSQPGISASDLAGLAPQDISQALQFKMSQEAMRDRRVSEVMDMLYKGAMLQERELERPTELAYKQALTNESINRVLQSSPTFEVPGLGIKLTREEAVKWMMTTPEDNRTADIKNYQFARTPEGGSYTGPFTEFTNPLTTNDWKNYQLAGGLKGTGKDYNEWLKDYRASGAPTTRITIGEKVEEKLAMGSVEARLQLYNPKDREKAIEDEFKKMGISDQIVAQMQGDSPEAKTLRTRNTVNAMNRLIVAGKGKIIAVKPSKDGKMMVWRVEWTNPDGSKKEELLTHVIN